VGTAHVRADVDLPVEFLAICLIFLLAYLCRFPGALCMRRDSLELSAAVRENFNPRFASAEIDAAQYVEMKRVLLK
jgi:hypothetical protein